MFEEKKEKGRGLPAAHLGLLLLFKPSATHLSYLFTAARSAQLAHLHRSFVLLLYGAHPESHVDILHDLTAGDCPRALFSTSCALP